MALNKPRAPSPDLLRSRLRDYRLEIIPVRNTPADFHSSFETAYLAWQRLWTPVLRQNGQPALLASDDFTRQDAIGAIFQDATCLALTLYRIVDLDVRPHRDDSYFQIWPESALAALARDSTRVLICSYLAVARAAQRRAFGVSLTAVMMAVNIRYLLDSDASVSAGITRNDRGMNSVCRAQGARVLAQDLKFHGFDVDLVAFYRNELSTLVTPYTEGLNEFWTNRRRTAPCWGNDSLAFNQKPHPA